MGCHRLLSRCGKPSYYYYYISTFSSDVGLLYIHILIRCGIIGVLKLKPSYYYYIFTFSSDVGLLGCHGLPRLVLASSSAPTSNNNSLDPKYLSPVIIISVYVLYIFKHIHILIRCEIIRIS